MLEFFKRGKASDKSDAATRSRSGPYDQRVFDVARTLGKIKGGFQEIDDSEVRSFLSFAMTLMPVSQAQVFQDAFVLWALNGKRDGFFVEFGATNGVYLSNTYLLETGYGWTGICAEPALGWHAELRENRKRALIETDCVWEATGEILSFSETRSPELSGLSDHTGDDTHANRRKSAQTYDVKTISLTDMLEKHGAPEVFDFLSIDTEGSEYRILAAHDFERFRPRVIAVEHNYTEMRQALFDLLLAKGYRRVLPTASLFDDWYVCNSIEAIGQV
jgi:FkbM family methyltransferase